jgi:hypothetical protein
VASTFCCHGGGDRAHIWHDDSRDDFVDPTFWQRVSTCLIMFLSQVFALVCNKSLVFCVVDPSCIDGHVDV